MNLEDSGLEFDLVLQRARAGDDDALTSLLEQFGSGARAALQIGPVWQAHIDADDVMQVTYMEAFLRIGSFAGAHAGAFRAWLGQLAENNLRDAIRALEAEKRPSPRRRIQSNGGDSYVQLCEMIGATTSTPSRAASDSEVRSLVDEALTRLPAEYADAIRLLDLQGLSGAEAGRQMNRSRAAVYMLVGRARERLRDLLGTPSRYFSR